MYYIFLLKGFWIELTLVRLGHSLQIRNVGVIQLLQNQKTSKAGDPYEKSENIPSRERSHIPQKWHFEDDFPFSKVGYVSSLEGIHISSLYFPTPMNCQPLVTSQLCHVVRSLLGEQIAMASPGNKIWDDLNVDLA